SLQASLDRLFGPGTTPAQAVARLLQDVRQDGDQALNDWSTRIDGAPATTISAADLAAAADRIPAALRDALTAAANRIRDFHSRQPLPDWRTTDMGGQVGQRVTPLNRVGVYVPGGTAPLPSSLLMGVIPAQVAGVPDILVATPPNRGGQPPADVILAAAHICGLDRIYQMGGAQAIAALAYGTATIPAVDKIVGPGNLFVTLAKQQLFGQVGIDGLYGPTETVVVADDTANPVWLAADLLAQAEHDVLATAILLTPSADLAAATAAEVERQTAQLSRADIIKTALATQGGIVITDDLAQAVTIADQFAPEHLCLAVANPEAWADKITRAGGLFLGERSFEVLGDYVAGPSHTMPTGGSARFASPLNVFDFVRITSIIALDAATAAAIAPTAITIAEAEQLTAHANAARLRLT
ncbi:MAG TPA: histidinol dehydrogenase, partial [Anaerolineae bacterium]|nr:histidinol dehydrogenase [Anaerolineae bacterium]